MTVQVVCGSRSIAEVPEQLTVENEVFLNVVSFTNHPQYDPSLGPIGGFDLAVYKVEDSPLQAPDVVSYDSGIWPACFPKEAYVEDVPGVVAGWRDPTPTFFSYNDAEQNANGYRLRNLELNQARMEVMKECKDPDWMKIQNSSYYPKESSAPKTLQLRLASILATPAPGCFFHLLAGPRDLVGTLGWEASACTGAVTRPPM